MARLTWPQRGLWFVLRALHAEHGLGGVLPADFVQPAVLRGAGGFLLGDVEVADIADSIAALQRAGLVELRDDGLALVDWDAAIEQSLCHSCGSRNPDPRHTRCPVCRSKDRKPRGENTDEPRSRKSEDSQDVASDSDAAPRTNRGASAGSLYLHSPSPSPLPTTSTQPNHHTPSPSPEGEVGGDPAEQPAEQQQPEKDGDGVEVAGRWAVAMVARGVVTMTAEHAANVVELLAELPGGAPRNVRSPAGLAANRLGVAGLLAAWCPSPERLARMAALAARRGVRNVGGYLRRAAERGDPGTFLARHGQGDGVLLPEHEQALAGPHRADVADLVREIAGPTTSPRSAAPPPPDPRPASAPPKASAGRREHPANMPVPFDSVLGNCECEACAPARARKRAASAAAAAKRAEGVA
jgi:hypothetical protein